MQAPAGGPPGVRTQGRKGGFGSHKACPPPCRGTGAAPYACAVLASCLRHACNEGKTTSPPPPHTHTSAPPRVGGAGREGRTAPPPRTRRKGGEAAERGCGTDHTTVPVGSTRRASPSGGGHRGCERRVGRATTGATRQAPPPTCRGTSAAPSACAVLATCLRQRTDSEDAPPPPPHSPPPTHESGEDGEGTWGGQRTDRNAGGRDEWRAVEVLKKKNKGHQRAREDRQQGQTGRGRSEEARQGARERGTPLGKKAGRQGPTPQRTGGAGVTRTRKRRW